MFERSRRDERIRDADAELAGEATAPLGDGPVDSDLPKRSEELRG